MTKGKGDGTAALRKAFKGRDYGERGQTKLRKKFGVLEKHKDYVVRAKSYKNKKKKLTALRLAASTRNPDEFNTAMHNTETDDHGRHVKNASNARYLQHKAAVDAGAVKQLQAGLSFMQLPPANTHRIFVDDEDELATFDAAAEFDTHPDLVNNPATRGSLSKLAEMELQPVDAESAKLEARKYHMLAERIKRKNKLEALAAVVADKQNLLKKGKRMLKPVEGSDSDKKSYKWLYERKS
eukprot:gene21668-33350_t